MRVYKASSPEGAAALRDIVERRNASNENALRVAHAMIVGVHARGDAYVAEQIAKFDGVTLVPEAIKVAPRDVAIGDEISEAIDTAITRIDAFHRPQLPQSYAWGSVKHRVRPIRRVGCYVPGGRAVYISTLMMTAVPARIAGVEEIVCITTPAAAERDELHYVCNRLGIREIYRCGGAAGVAAGAPGHPSPAGAGSRLGSASKTRRAFAGAGPPPPAAGDYVVGSNHVLPTAGSARFFSPLGVYDFVKRANVVSLGAEELAEIAP